MGRGRPKGFVVSEETKRQIAATKSLRRLERLASGSKDTVARIAQARVRKEKPIAEKPVEGKKPKYDGEYVLGICPVCGNDDQVYVACDQCGWGADIPIHEKGTTQGPRWDLISREETSGKTGSRE